VITQAPLGPESDLERYRPALDVTGADIYPISYPPGTHSDLRTFGHNGSSICNTWADPGRGLAFAYLTNLGAPRRASLRHNADPGVTNRAGQRRQARGPRCMR